jgi:hypothetical protein
MLRKGIAQFVRRPGGGRMLGDSNVNDLSMVVFEDHEDE